MEPTLKGLGLLSFLEYLLLQLANLTCLLCRYKFLFVSLLGGPAQLVLDLAQLVLHLLLLAQHPLQLSLVVISRRIICIFHSLHLLGNVCLFLLQLGDPGF